MSFRGRERNLSRPGRELRHGRLVSNGASAPEARPPGLRPTRRVILPARRSLGEGGSEVPTLCSYLSALRGQVGTQSKDPSAIWSAAARRRFAFLCPPRSWCRHPRLAAAVGHPAIGPRRIHRRLNGRLRNQRAHLEGSSCLCGDSGALARPHERAFFQYPAPSEHDPAKLTPGRVSSASHPFSLF